MQEVRFRSIGIRFRGERELFQVLGAGQYLPFAENLQLYDLDLRLSPRHWTYSPLNDKTTAPPQGSAQGSSADRYYLRRQQALSV